MKELYIGKNNELEIELLDDEDSPYNEATVSAKLERSCIPLAEEVNTDFEAQGSGRYTGDMFIPETIAKGEYWLVWSGNAEGDNSSTEADEPILEYEKVEVKYSEPGDL